MAISVLALIGFSTALAAEVRDPAECNGWVPSPPRPITDQVCVPPDTSFEGYWDVALDWEWATTPAPQEEARAGRDDISPNLILPGFHNVLSEVVAAYINDDNGDGLINDLDTPDVVFTASKDFTPGADSPVPGALTVVDGRTHETMWSKNSFTLDEAQLGTFMMANPSVGDLDGDGSPEICIPARKVLFLCTDNQGNLKFWGDSGEQWQDGELSLGDMDGDGQAEIVAGNHVFSNTGELLGSSIGTNGKAGFTALVDWDLDGDLEGVNTDVVFDETGATVVDMSPGGSAQMAVADVTGDGLPDAVAIDRANSQLGVIDNSGVVLWFTTWSHRNPDGGGSGAQPAVGDITGDDAPEIVIGEYEAISAWTAEGDLLWDFTGTEADPLVDNSNTGPVLADLDGDGKDEVIVEDENRFWILDGSTGAILATEDQNFSSATFGETPIVADVDRDGSAEIILANSNFYRDTEQSGISVFGSPTQSWRRLRGIWNQGYYSITNVADDGSLPEITPPNNPPFNSFREQASLSGKETDLARLDIHTVETCWDGICDDHENLRGGLHFYVSNGGTRDALNVPIELRADAPDGPLVWSEILDIPSMGTVEIGPLSFSETPIADELPWASTLYAVVVGFGGYPECGDPGDVWPLGTIPLPTVDIDNDGTVDVCDDCIFDGEPVDADDDGVEDACELCSGDDASGDTDADGICDDIDSCVDIANADQLDADDDGIGDVCDFCDGDDATGDSDLDGVCDDIDVCLGDDASGDTDSDGICNDTDNCVADGNLDQADADDDGSGDACDLCAGDDTRGDTDTDGVCDDLDNCISDANSDQADEDDNGVGDACELPDEEKTWVQGGCACNGSGTSPLALLALLPALWIRRRRA